MSIVSCARDMVANKCGTAYGRSKCADPPTGYFAFVAHHVKLRPVQTW